MLEGELWGIQQQEAVEVGSYRSRGLETSQGIQRQEAIEVGFYRSRGLEKAVLEVDLSGDTATGGYRSSRL